MNLDVNFSKMSVSGLTDIINELKKRALGLDSHYKLDNFDISKLAYKNENPPLGIMGTSGGFLLSFDISKKSQFISEYNSLMQILKAEKQYKVLKETEIVDPSALSSLLMNVEDKRKIFEDRAMQILGLINQVLKSIVSIIYELKELDRNLLLYDKSKSSDKSTAEAAELELRRIFVDNVDAKKGGASMISLSRSASQPQGGAGFIDIVSVFYAIKNQGDIDKLNKNEMYKNILKARFAEYQDWKKINEEDLRMRRNMLLQYLESQAASFEFYKKLAFQYLSYLNRINLATQSKAPQFMQSTKILDIAESSMFYVNMIAFKEVYARNYQVAWKKLLNSTKFTVPEMVEQKTIEILPVIKGVKEGSREFIRKSLSKYGPKVIAAIGIEFSFKEKQMFPQGVSQIPAQYEGTLDIKLVPYCFTLYEWYLFRNALAALIDKTVFEGISGMTVTSLDSIKKDLDHYIEEAKKIRTPEKPKTNNLAIIDIYNSFKQDFLNILKPISTSSKNQQNFNAETYEIIFNNRHFSSISRKDAIKIGLAVAINDAGSAFEEFKSRLKFLNTFIPKYRL